MEVIDEIKHIGKEEIKFLHFPKQEVLDTKTGKRDRYLKLMRSLRFGNSKRQKAKIVFADDEGAKEVESTIWGVTDTYVILKQSAIIPLERIIDIT